MTLHRPFVGSRLRGPKCSMTHRAVSIRIGGPLGSASAVSYMMENRVINRGVVMRGPLHVLHNRSGAIAFAPRRFPRLCVRGPHL